ncbi:MAG: aldehyde dehydrogenase (NADP(+)) [Bryobacteraceae bacterium]
MTETRPDATLSEIDRAVNAAGDAFERYSVLPPDDIAAFLEAIATGIEGLGDDLLRTASAESSLPMDRLTGERGRTVGQLRMFAGLVRDGAWKDVRVDQALPDRKPLRRPDLRRVLMPIGPVAVWAASNFPLAFSVAGGDTAAALAAGCPVIVKAHPGHPKTSDLVSGVISKAASELKIPHGTFSLLHGASPEVSVALVRHPGIAAGAFTGSHRAGRALFDAAVSRPTPIPFFAEMGSVNPLFALPGALEARGEAIADGLAAAVNLGVGQFCTCPGLVVAVESEALEQFAGKLRDRFGLGVPGTMLTPQIARSYREAVSRIDSMDGVRTTRPQNGSVGESEALPALFETTARAFLEHEELGDEVFGPSTILVRCANDSELRDVASNLNGSLTATIHGTPADLEDHRSLIFLLSRKAGRLIYNGYPTGVEVCSAMQHGGPYPATSDPRFTSVGTAAIQRFARPICFQDFPAEFLPEALRDA